MNRHYHVFCGMPGYLPDNEPEVYTTRKDAEIAAKWYADGYRDFIADTGGDQETTLAEPWRITGSARKGCYVIERGEFATPIYITIDPCTDTTCALHGDATS